MSLNIAKFFSKKKHQSGSSETVGEIGLPTNVSHEFHVIKNAETGQLEGLPDIWINLLNAQISKAEQNNNPEAALHAIKFYNYSIKNKPQETLFKPFVTEDLIQKECHEINQIFNNKPRYFLINQIISDDTVNCLFIFNHKFTVFEQND